MTVRRSPRLPLETLRPYLLDIPQSPATEEGEPRAVVLDWHAVFGNDHGVEIEVGFGKGLFLLSASEAHPEVNFLGIEIVRKYQLFTATRLAKRQHTNVRVACADARLVLRDQVATNSVRAVHVYFPDPWWKKRHHKRRVFTAEFAIECTRILDRGGLLHVATDVEDYAVLVREAVGQTPLQELPPPGETAPVHDLDYLTNFERKFRIQGKTIYRMRYEKP
jgi:tRNA (guanine-N7-)-methyltransferase